MSRPVAHKFSNEADDWKVTRSPGGLSTQEPMSPVRSLYGGSVASPLSPTRLSCRNGRASSISSPTNSRSRGMALPRPISPASLRLPPMRDIYQSPTQRSPASNTSRLEAARAIEGRERRQSNIKAVMMVLKHQSELDRHIEEAKTMLPSTMSLEGLFNSLDRMKKGYVTDTDLWRFTQDFGASTLFGSLCALVLELQLRVPSHGPSTPGHLSMRGLAGLIFPVHSKEYEYMLHAANDHDLLSELHLHRYAEPCPGCGVRVQRDADAAGCPNVTCPVCQTSFRCYAIMGDGNLHQWEDHTVPSSVQNNLHKLVDLAASAADDLDTDRKQLAMLPQEDILGALSDAFSFISEGRLSFTVKDLRRAFLDHGILLTHDDLNVLWFRYQPFQFADVSFEDFSHHLKPRVVTRPSIS